MIKLDVREYCDRCPHFEPEVAERPQVNILTSDMTIAQYDKIRGFCNTAKKRMAVTHGDTVVACCNRYRCESIYEYMEGRKKC